MSVLWRGGLRGEAYSAPELSLVYLVELRIMRQNILAITLLIISATVSEAQTCTKGDPATALGTYCNSDFDGG